METEEDFPGRLPGTYVLLLWLAADSTVEVGRLGTFALPAGWYAYTGSAFGLGGLRGRLKHHRKPVSKPHWHVDYLRRAAPLQAIWYAHGETNQEHDWAKALTAMPGASLPVPRFGASDCTCPAHLIHFTGRPDVGTFRKLTDMAIHVWQA